MLDSFQMTLAGKYLSSYNLPKDEIYDPKKLPDWLNRLDLTVDDFKRVFACDLEEFGRLNPKLTLSDVIGLILEIRDEK